MLVKMFCMQKLGQKVVPVVAFSKIRVISGLNDMLRLIMVFNQGRLLRCGYKQSGSRFVFTAVTVLFCLVITHWVILFPACQ